MNGFTWNLQVNLMVIAIVGYIIRMMLKYNSSHTRDRAFVSMGVCCIMVASSDIFWSAMSNGILNWPLAIGYIFNIIYLFTLSMIGYFWFIYAEMTMNIPWTRSNRMIYLFALPELVLLILLIISVWTGMVFSIDSSMVYHRGPLLPLATFINIAYPTFTCLRAFIRSFNNKYYIYRSLYRNMIGFLLFPSIGAVLLFLDPNAPYMASGIALAMIFAFFIVQDSCIQYDDLTDMPNRRRLYPYLEEIISEHNVFSQKDLYFITVDMTNYKRILHQYGASEADRAAVIMADVVKDIAKDYNCFVARYQAEKFAIVFETEEPDEINALVVKIKETLESMCEIPYDLVLIYAYSRYDKVSMNCAKNLVDVTAERLIEKKEKITEALVTQ